MYKYILQSVEGLHWFDTLPTLLFFGTFVLVLVMIFVQKKSDFDTIANLPLEETSKSAVEK